MNKIIWEKIEHYNSKLIAPSIVALLIIIVMELFVHPENHTVKIIIEVMDYLVLAVFIIDLAFLAAKAKSVTFFFKNYWLDIVAIIPIALIFTVFSYFYRTFLLAERVVVSQQIMHETLEAKKGLTFLSRTERFSKYIKIGARLVKVIAKSHALRNIRHHTHKRKMKGPKRKKLNQNRSPSIKR